MNLYRVTIDKCEKVIGADVITQRTHNIEANNFYEAYDMIHELYDKFEDVIIADIVKVERIATDIIHFK